MIFSDPEVTTDENGRWIIVNSDVSKPRVEVRDPDILVLEELLRLGIVKSPEPADPPAFLRRTPKR